MTTMSEDTKSRLDAFYIDIMKKAERIEEDVPEKKNLFLDGFFGLIRNGHKYDIEEKIPEIEKEEEEDRKPRKSKKKKDEIIDDDPTLSLEPIRMLIMVIDGVYYRASEIDLQYAFGNLYEQVVEYHEEQKKKPRLQRGNDSDGFFLPDVYSGNEEEAVSDNQNLPAAGNGALVPSGNGPVQEEVATLPYIPFDTNYPNDEPDFKDYDSFLFNSHETSVRFPDGSERIYQTYVYPLNPDTEDCLVTDILAIMVDPNGNTRYGMSKPKNDGKKSVNEEYPDISFVIRGYWEDGRFESSVAVIHTKNGVQPILNDRVHHVEPTKRTSSFYLRHIVENGNVLNVFPLGLLRNDTSTGLAPCFLMLEDGHERTPFMDGNNNYVTMTLNKETVKATVFWAGNSLNLGIDTINR